MKKLYTLLLCSIGLGTINNCYAQLLITADAVVASSTDFVSANALVDANTSTYAYLSAALGVLSTSSITVSFPQSGHAGDVVSFSVQGTGGLLSTSLLNNTTIRLYDDNNINVANASGSSLLDLSLGLSGPNVYNLKFVTDPTATYTIKKATLEFNNVLTAQVLNEIRVYNATIQTPCTAVYASTVNSTATGLLGNVSNSTNAVTASTTDFATINAAILGSTYIDLAFATKGTAGEFVGFTVDQAASLLSLGVLQNISIDVYNSSGTNVSTKNNFGLADLRLLDGSTTKYVLGYTTPAGAYDIARLRITLSGLNVLTSINVYNAFHYKMVVPTVSITSSASDFCDGSSVTLTANTTSPSSILWSNGSTTNSITVSNTNTLSFTATDAEGCMSKSLPITVTKLPIPTISISNGPTASFCSGASTLLTAVPSAGASVLWSTGATTNTISVNTPATYTVKAIGTNLCQSLQSSVVVSQLALPTVSISNGATAGFCANKNVILTAVPSAGATVVWSNAATTNSITVNTPGIYTVTAKDANLCSSAIASVTVTSLTIPTVSISNGPATTFCANKNVVLTAVPSAGATVLWSNAATTNSITVNTAGTYTVTATDANLCSSAIGSVIVTSLPIPTVSISNGPATTFCANKNVVLTAVPSAGATVLWNNSAITNSITVNTAGTYTVTATGANLCASDIASVTVTSLTIPTVSISNGPATTFCANKNVVLTAVPSAGSTVLWSNAATTNSITVNTGGTYTVTATDANLCSSAIGSVTVTSLPIPTVSISNGPTTTFCANKNVVLTAVPSAGATVLWNNAAITNSITVNTAGTYTVTATGANLCASDIASVTVTSLTVPTVSISNGPATTFCANKNVTLTAVPSAGATVLWSNAATTNSITVNTAGTYTVTATAANLCSSDIASVDITSLTIPTVSISNGPATTFCANKDVTLTAVPSAGATVLWSNMATTNDITVNTAGTYTVTATGLNLCASDIASVTVTSLTIPTVSISNGPATSFCANKDVILTAVPSAGATVLWSNAATTNSITVNTAGTYTATATAANLCSSDIASVDVTSLTIPTVSISNGPATTFCANKDVILTAVPSVGATVLWSNAATTNSITVNTAGTYTVTATDVNLCNSDIASVDVTSLTIPTVSISNGPATSFCSNKNVTLTAVPSAGATVLWNNMATTNDITVSTAGTYSVTATDVNLCSSADASIVVSSLTAPTVSISNGPAAAFCINKDITLSAIPSAGATILWSNGASTNDITVNTAGTYTVTATAANLCISDIASVDVTSLALPTVSISNGSTATFCSNQFVVLTAVPSTGATILWDNGANTNNITVSTAGTFTVTATDANLCSSADASVTVSSLTAPTISITATGPTDICAKDNVTLSATPSAGATVLWSNGATTNDITVNMADDFSATATASNGCTNTSTIITVTLKASPSVTGSAIAITCNGANNGSIAITPASSGASYQYSWSNGAATSSINQLAAGNYTVTITDNSTLCTTDLAYVITQPQALSFTGAITRESCSGNDGSISFEIAGGTLPYSYNSTSVKNDHITGLTNGTYSFTITDKNMCQLTQSYTVEKANCSVALNIHDVVTPNNDGLNDVMVIEGLENFPNCSLEIFDKWGDVVYKKDNYDNSWNGRKNNSNPLPTGTYYYLLKLNASDVPNGKSDYTGYVMVQ